jgi:hypothetical protein
MGAEVVEEEKGGHRMAKSVSVQEGNLKKVRDFVARW